MMTAKQKELYEYLEFYMAQVERAATDAEDLGMDVDTVLSLIKQNIIDAMETEVWR